MTKQEFLEELRKALTGEVPRSVRVSSFGFMIPILTVRLEAGKGKKRCWKSWEAPDWLRVRLLILQKAGKKGDRRPLILPEGITEEHASGYSEPERPKRNPAVTLLLYFDFGAAFSNLHIGHHVSFFIFSFRPCFHSVRPCLFLVCGQKKIICITIRKKTY